MSSEKLNIISELQEMESFLALQQKTIPFSAPAGYFDSLADRVLKRVIKADEESAASELASLSPLLDSISRKLPYTVPENYFSDEKNRGVALTGGALNDGVWKQLSKEQPYTVPAAYFETLPQRTLERVHELMAPAKIVQMKPRRWYQYAAAAVVTGLIAVTVIFFNQSDKAASPGADSYAWMKKNMKTVNTTELNNFIELTEKDNNTISSATGQQNDIKNLMNDVSDKEIKDFLEEIPEDEADNSDNI